MNIHKKIQSYLNFDFGIIGNGQYEVESKKSKKVDARTNLFIATLQLARVSIGEIHLRGINLRL